MTKRATALVLALAASVAGGGALAQAGDAAVKARKAHMGLQAFYIGQLSAIAKGEAPYDAETATVLAEDLALLTSIDQRFYWVPGTAQGEVEGSRLLPAAFEEGSDIFEDAAALNEAANALAAAAGTDLAALQAGLGPVGQACGACHEAYRAPQ